MNYWELETEAWELFPDDSYDGAHHIQNRGRVEFLEELYKKSIERDSTH